MSRNRLALKATVRANAGKGAARAVRRQGNIPAVIYGDKKEPILISLNENDLNKLVIKAGLYTSLCDLDVDGKKHLVITRDVQLHPVTTRPEHADFLRVTEKTLVRVDVPVKFINDRAAPGIQRGGVLNVLNYSLSVYCFAQQIPDHIDVDLTGCDVGDSVHWSDLKVPDGVSRVNANDDITVCTITAPTAMKAEAEAAATPAAAVAAAPAAGAAAPAAAAGAKPGAAAPAAAAKPAAKK